MNTKKKEHVNIIIKKIMQLRPEEYLKSQSKINFQNRQDTKNLIKIYILYKKERERLACPFFLNLSFIKSYIYFPYIPYALFLQQTPISISFHNYQQDLAIYISHFVLIFFIFIILCTQVNQIAN